MFGIGVRKKHGRQTQFQKRFGPIVTVLVILPSKLPYLMYFSLDMPMTKNLILNMEHQMSAIVVFVEKVM